LWPRELHRAALFLGTGGALYWVSYALDGTTLWVPSFGLVYVDLLLAWLAVLVDVAAWPPLYAGLQELRHRAPGEANTVVAWRSFVMTLVLVLAGIVLLPLRYHSVASTQAWLLVLYVSAFPFLAWTFVPILALHGILFGRVANYLDPRRRRLVDTGAMLLFAVAAATVAVILQNPGAMTFVRSWSVGQGLLPAAAAAGYVLIAFALTFRPAPVLSPPPVRAEPRGAVVPARSWAAARKALPVIRGWAAAKTPAVRR